jgi:hypothetical protein
MLYYRIAFRVDDDDIQSAHTEQKDSRCTNNHATDHYMSTVQCQALEGAAVDTVEVDTVEVPVEKQAPQESGVEKGTEFWKWRSTLLSSPHALFTLLRAYSYIPKDQIRIFFASSEDDMDEMLLRQNHGQVASSVTADEFLAGQRINQLDVRRLELELAPLSDCDMPYKFTLPTKMSERIAWVVLMKKHMAGLLES